MTVIDLAAEAERRERYTVALAGAVRECIHAEPEDPTPIQEDLAELCAELRTAAPDVIVEYYRSAIELFVTPPGCIIDHNLDPAPHHQACLAWSREYLARIERDFGVRLLDFRGVSA